MTSEPQQNTTRDSPRGHQKRTYSARVMRFRESVYRHRGELTAGCQLLLLRLSDSMDANANVSVPRSRLAEDLACPPARVTEWIAEARRAGFLSRVRRGRPRVTAVYQGLHVVGYVRPKASDGTAERPGREPDERYAQADPSEVRHGVPPSVAQRYATGGSQEVVGPAANSQPAQSTHPQATTDPPDDYRSSLIYRPPANPPTACHPAGRPNESRGAA